MSNTETRRARLSNHDRDCLRIYESGDPHYQGEDRADDYDIGRRLHLDIYGTDPHGPAIDHLDAERTAYAWASAEQGFVGTFTDWLDLPAEERRQYEDGAAGIGG